MGTTGSTDRGGSADNMRLANIERLEIPKSQNQRKFSRTHYAITPEGTESETVTSESKGPEARLAKKYRKVRSDSEEKDHIPLAELANETKTASENSSASDSEDSDVSGPTESSDEDRVSKMEVDNVFRNKQKKYRKVKTEKRKVKKILKSLVGVF